jgi:ABC-type branched-subunit amino acid transport system permease subunit
MARQTTASAEVALLALSAVALIVGTAMMPEGYDALRHTTSEAAAQGQEHAWITRLGFVALAVAVLALAGSRRTGWWRSARAGHLAFALGMLGTAVLAHRPWQPELPHDALEDLLHSVAATLVGFAFVAGVLARMLQRLAERRRGIAADIVALIAATVLPLAMLAWPELAGLLQRLMFLVAFLWYAHEALEFQGGGAA